MNDTPQTDNLARGNHVVPTEFAQELEMERNHAQEGLARAGLIIAQMQKNADELEAELARLREKCRKAEASLAQIVNDDSTDRFVYGRINEAFAAVRGEEEAK
jgi:septal ring factor EnvC (AmiA/AmiB activator)